MKSDYPCVCGHVMIDHEVWLKDPEYPNRMLLGPCQYHELSCKCDVFRKDNLRYLEIMRELKTSRRQVDTDSQTP